MKKLRIFTALLLAFTFLFLTACSDSSDPVCINCKDSDRDGKCDKCGEEVIPEKEVCDKCNDSDGDGKCDECGEKIKSDDGLDACVYATTRDVSGRDIKYVEICFEDFGSCVILLDATTAPVTVANFISLVEKGFYDGLTMHRIIKDFMVQGGDPDGNGTGGNKDENGNKLEIKGEFDENGHKNDISHLKGVISMARSTAPNSASSQFFICNADATSSLDGKYAAFGYVVEGLEVIDELTEEVFPKTAYADYYGDYSIDPNYNTYKHVVWQYLGNGAIENDDDKPVIKYIKVLDNYNQSV